MAKKKKENSTEKLKPNAIDDRRRELNMSWQQLEDASEVTTRTIKKANQGLACFVSKLEKIGIALGKDWTHFLPEARKAQLHIPPELFSAIGSGLQFEEFFQKLVEKMVHKSFGHPEVEKGAQELLDLLGSTNQRTDRATLILWQVYIMRAQYGAALRVAETMLARSRTDADLAHAKRAIGECNFYTGNFKEALLNLEH